MELGYNLNDDDNDGMFYAFGCIRKSVCKSCEVISDYTWGQAYNSVWSLVRDSINDSVEFSTYAILTQLENGNR